MLLDVFRRGEEVSQKVMRKRPLGVSVAPHSSGVEDLPESAPVVPPPLAVLHDTERHVVSDTAHESESDAGEKGMTTIAHRGITTLVGRSHVLADRFSSSSWARPASPITTMGFPRTFKYTIFPVFDVRKGWWSWRI